MGVLDDTLIFYLLGDNGASGEGGPRGTFREHLVGHGIQDETADMAARLDTLGDPTTYGIYPAGWALAMNTPYPWTKQVAHLGGTRDGMIVRWGNGIAGPRRDPAPVAPRHRRAADDPRGGRARGAGDLRRRRAAADRGHQPALHASATPEAPDRHTTQYFEMIGNRGVYHEGWTAVTRHGIPWEMVGAPESRSTRTSGSSTTTPVDWSQARDVAARAPREAAELQAIFQREAERFHVLPLDDRVTERENPDVAGRLDLHLGRSTLSFGPRVGRLTEEAAPNVKNRSHVITADLELVTGTNGVVVAQGGRFGGWSLYVVGGVPHYAYNYVGRDLTVVRGGKPMMPGRHDLVVRFDYDGGPPGSGAEVTLRGRRRHGRLGPGPGDDGLLLLLRRDLQRRASTAGRPWSTTTCRCATGSRD